MWASGVLARTYPESRLDELVCRHLGEAHLEEDLPEEDSVSGAREQTPSGPEGALT